MRRPKRPTHSLGTCSAVRAARQTRGPLHLQAHDPPIYPTSETQARRSRPTILAYSMQSPLLIPASRHGHARRPPCSAEGCTCRIWKHLEGQNTLAQESRRTLQLTAQITSFYFGRRIVNTNPTQPVTVAPGPPVSPSQGRSTVVVSRVA